MLRRRRIEASIDPPLEAPSYPDGSPCSHIEREISRLNLQTFPASDVAQIDDLLVWALCGSKRRQSTAAAWHPHPAFSRGKPASERMTKEDATLVANMFQVAKSHLPLTVGIQRMAQDLVHQFPGHFNGANINIIIHLLKRYFFLFSDESPVALQKVQFDGRVVAGLRATRTIPAATPLLVTCSSLSSNVIGTTQAISVIESSPSHLGPSGERLVLGPFRFANHDCSPNSQFQPIRGTHAVVIWSLVDIEPGTPITVSYASDGSYFGEGGCRCTSCTGKSIHLPARRIQTLPSKPKTRRGGKKARERKAKAAAKTPCSSVIGHGCKAE